MPSRFTWLMLSLACLLIAVGLTMELLPESPRFSVEQPDRFFDSLAADKAKQLTFRIRNLSSAPMRVVGAEYS